MIGLKGNPSNPILLLVKETSVMGTIMQRAIEVCANNGVVGFNEAPYYRGMYLNIYNGINSQAMNMKHHTDKPAGLGNKVIGVSLGSSADLLMRKSPNSCEERIPLCHGSMYAMTGNARTRYQHAIEPSQKCARARNRRAKLSSSANTEKGSHERKRRKRRVSSAETRVSITLRSAHLSMRSLPSRAEERLRRNVKVGMPDCFVPDNSSGKVKRVVDVGHVVVANETVKLVDHVFDTIIKQAHQESCLSPSFLKTTTGEIPTLSLVQRALDIVRKGTDDDVWSLQWLSITSFVPAKGVRFLTQKDVKGVGLRIENLTIR